MGSEDVVVVVVVGGGGGLRFMMLVGYCGSVLLLRALEWRWDGRWSPSLALSRLGGSRTGHAPNASRVAPGEGSLSLFSGYHRGLTMGYYG